MGGEHAWHVLHTCGLRGATFAEPSPIKAWATSQAHTQPTGEGCWGTPPQQSEQAVQYGSLGMGTSSCRDSGRMPLGHPPKLAPGLWRVISLLQIHGQVLLQLVVQLLQVVLRLQPKGRRPHRTCSPRLPQLHPRRGYVLVFPVGTAAMLLVLLLLFTTILFVIIISSSPSSSFLMFFY